MQCFIFHSFFSPQPVPVLQIKCLFLVGIPFLAVWGFWLFSSSVWRASLINRLFVDDLYYTCQLPHCRWFIFRPQTFNFYNQDVLVKLRRTSVLVVVVILFGRHASDKSQEAISWRRTWRFFLQCLSIKYVVSDHFRWGDIPINQNKMRMCLHFAQIRIWHRCLKLSFFGLYINVINVRSLKSVPSC